MKVDTLIIGLLLVLVIEVFIAVNIVWEESRTPAAPVRSDADDFDGYCDYGHHIGEVRPGCHCRILGCPEAGK